MEIAQASADRRSCRCCAGEVVAVRHPEAREVALVHVEDDRKSVGTDGYRLPDTGRPVRLLDDSQTLFRFAPPTRSNVVSDQQFPDTVFQRLEMRVDDSRNSQWVDIAQIVVHEDIAEAANFPPGNFRAAGLQRLRQVLGSLRQGLQIAQRCIVQDLVLSQITSRLDPSNLGDGIQNMLRIGMPGLVHKSTASRMTWSRI